MAKRQEPTRGSWLLAEELLDRGDAAFVDELRHIHDADRLGAFAARWHADKRPAARRLMLEYLAQPLNAFRHEPLVKRLFKLAEKSGDDALLARFLVAFDRSVRRQLKKRHRHDWNTRESWTEETVRVPSGTAMPRSTKAQRFRNTVTGELMVAPTPQKQTELRLFSVHTRNYMRRRAWRYFRQLGKQQPQRYLPAIVEALQQYTDADLPDGLALLDNWGLVHALFGVCPALVAKPHGWTLAEGRNLAEMKRRSGTPTSSGTHRRGQAQLSVRGLRQRGRRATGIRFATAPRTTAAANGCAMTIALVTPAAPKPKT